MDQKRGLIVIEVNLDPSAKKTDPIAYHGVRFEFVNSQPPKLFSASECLTGAWYDWDMGDLSEKQLALLEYAERVVRKEIYEKEKTSEKPIPRRLIN